MQSKLLYIICMLHFAIFGKGFAQSTQAVTYTTKDGLPSNNIYLTRIDKKGFLWIATDNGLARFDGKRFKVFTTAQGLTDNEIVDLHIDSNNVIWAIPFLHTPCYFNEKKQRFENPDTDPELGKIIVGNTNSVSALRFGGILFGTNTRNAYLYRNGKTTLYQEYIGKRLSAFRKAVDYQPDKYLLFSDDSIRRFEEGKISASFAAPKTLSSITLLYDRVAAVMNDEVMVMRVAGDGIPQVLHQKKFSFPVTFFSFTGKHFMVVTHTGSKYLVDTATLEIREELVNSNTVRSVLEDNNGNTWLCTVNSGLIKIQPKNIKPFFPAELAATFNTLAKTSQLLISGNNSGELISYDGLFHINKVQLSDAKKLDGTIRKIIPLPEAIFVSCQGGSVLMNKSGTKILRRFERSRNNASKMAAKINDSMICMGSHAMAYKYNYYRNTYTDSVLKRVSALCVDKDGDIYIGSTDGIYKWTANHLQTFGQRHKALSYRTNTIIQSPEGLVWVGLGTDTLVVMQQDNPIAFIPLGRAIIGSMCKALYCDKPGQVWLGTNKGLNKINYSFADNTFTYSSTAFGMADGLPGEQVNDITGFNDTMYVATQGGLCFLPENLRVDTKDIPSFINSVSINGTDRVLEPSYELNYDENNISIDFSGIDLSGFIPHFEYSINNGSWLPTERIELSRLAPGSYNIRIRAINRDSTPSAREARIDFYIRTPFWKNSLFWLLATFLCFGAIIYFLQKRSREKQRLALARSETERKLAQLEMQALMAQINPHFVFNCLNSIKGLVYDKAYKQADSYLDKFADLLRSTMDNAEASVITLEKEINYLDTYLQLEKLRFDNTFDYVINANAAIDARSCYVPAMLLQPYVENAIRHGVRYLDSRKGNITISAHTTKDTLVFTIEDDGIGRAKAQALKSSRHMEYQSRGMLLSKRRAELYQIGQQVIDKTDETGNGTGTIIVLQIPLSLKP